MSRFLSITFGLAALVVLAAGCGEGGSDAGESTGRDQGQWFSLTLERTTTVRQMGRRPARGTMINWTVRRRPPHRPSP